VRRGDQGGFALVAALWMVALLALAATALAVWVGRATEEARMLRQRVHEETTLANAKAGVVFAFMVQPLSGRGLEVSTSLSNLRAAIQMSLAQPFNTNTRSEDFVYLDDRPYRFGESAEIRIQDGRGLINLNLATRDEVMRLLNRLGVAQDRLDPLVSKLQDFVDHDDLVRLNGAERDDYVREGQPPPPNMLLRTVWEAQRVMGWKTETALWRKDALPEITSTSAVIGYNLNTMPAIVLEVAAGMTEETAVKAVQARLSSPFLGQDALIGYGAPMVIADPLRFIPFPADTMRVTFTFRPSGRRVQMVFVLTPSSLEAPWRIDYLMELTSVARDGASSDPLPEFPDPAALLAPR
jgi:type II secretory pathway component PulK